MFKIIENLKKISEIKILIFQTQTDISFPLVNWTPNMAKQILGNDLRQAA